MQRPIVSPLGFMGFTSDDTPDREKKIKEILSRGKVAVFTNNQQPTIIKKVREWNPNKDGDLECFYSTGATRLLCWESAQYEISEQ